ncbi:hypothetical protein ENBRE01_2615 [Enteropsectra breve]|nr:hypothetical protein ENBRE01_2575 [Enteropsectra breve]KAI5152161.1 hypothetical protein ENBRE01_2615 [Enteropsectra breve]
MNHENQCIICCGEYSTEGAHRTVALKCGHIFGHECILRWLTENKRPFCPICSEPCRKNHLRIIFCTQIVALDSEAERVLVEKYVKENAIRKELEKEVGALKAQIDILKLSMTNRLESEKYSVDSQNEYSKPYVLKTTRAMLSTISKIGAALCDPLNRTLLIACWNSGIPGILKYSLNDLSIYKFISLACPVSHMRLSPSNDGLCVYSFGSTIRLVNLYNDVVILECEVPEKIMGICFWGLFKKVFFITASNTVHIMNLENGEQYPIYTAENMKAVHGLECVENKLYIGSLFGIASLNVKGLSSLCDSPVEVEEMLHPEGKICTAISSGNSILCCVLRNEDFGISFLLKGKKEIEFVSGVVHRKKHFIHLFNGMIFCGDDAYGEIKAIGINSLKEIQRYKPKEGLCSFAVCEEYLVIVGEKRIEILDKG